MITTDVWYLHCLGPATTITQIYDTATGPGTINDQLVVELLFRTSNNGPDLQYLHAKSFLFLSLGVATIVIFIILLPLCIVSVSMPPAATPPLIERWWTWGLWRIQQSLCLLNTQRQKQLKNKPSSCCIHYSRQEPWPHVQLQSSVSQPVMCVRASLFHRPSCLQLLNTWTWAVGHAQWPQCMLHAWRPDWHWPTHLLRWNWKGPSTCLNWG